MRRYHLQFQARKWWIRWWCCGGGHPSTHPLVVVLRNDLYIAVGIVSNKSVRRTVLRNSSEKIANVSKWIAHNAQNIQVQMLLLWWWKLFHVRYQTLRRGQQWFKCDEGGTVCHFGPAPHSRHSSRSLSESLVHGPLKSSSVLSHTRTLRKDSKYENIECSNQAN